MGRVREPPSMKKPCSTAPLRETLYIVVGLIDLAVREPPSMKKPCSTAPLRETLYIVVGLIDFGFLVCLFIAENRYPFHVCTHFVTFCQRPCCDLLVEPVMGRYPPLGMTLLRYVNFLQFYRKKPAQGIVIRETPVPTERSQHGSCKRNSPHKELSLMSNSFQAFYVGLLPPKIFLAVSVAPFASEYFFSGPFLGMYFTQLFFVLLFFLEFGRASRVWPECFPPPLFFLSFFFFPWLFPRLSSSFSFQWFWLLFFSTSGAPVFLGLVLRPFSTLFLFLVVLFFLAFLMSSFSSGCFSFLALFLTSVFFYTAVLHQWFCSGSY